MKPTYQIEHDGQQWHLHRSADKADRTTGAISRITRTVGYYPMFHQAVAQMYELAVADDLGIVGLEDVPAAVATALEIRNSLAGVPDCKKCVLI